VIRVIDPPKIPRMDSFTEDVLGALRALPACDGRDQWIDQLLAARSDWERSGLIVQLDEVARHSADPHPAWVKVRRSAGNFLVIVASQTLPPDLLEGQQEFYAIR